MAVHKLLPPIVLVSMLLSRLACGQQQGLSVSRTGQGDDALLEVSLNGNVWFREVEGISQTFLYKDGQKYAKGDLLQFSDETELSGGDVFGHFEGMAVSWEPSFETSYKVYDTNDFIIFSQTFTEVVNGTGQANLSDLDRGINSVSSSYPSLVPSLEEGGPAGFWTFGGRMAGTPCISIGRLLPSTSTIRGGNYGGVLTLFSENGSEVVLVSALTNHMVHSLVHRPNTAPDADQSNPGALDFGLLGTVSQVDQAGFTLETVMVYGQSFEEAWMRWGEILRTRSGGGKVVPVADDDDFASNYLSFWTDNGGFYYYNTMANLTYEETFIELSQRFEERGIPVRSAEIDSWWYEKDPLLAVVNWDTPLEDVFPSGLAALQQQTGFRMIGHNRYWSRNNDYYQSYDFEREIFAIPQSQEFWVDLFNNATNNWDLILYFQDWQDFQQVFMSATVSDIHVATDWLRQMSAGADESGVDVQYCMTLQRELLQASEFPRVTRVRASEDYLLAEDQWRIGITSHAAYAIGVKPYKDVFWTSVSNPGNKFYYDCMEVSNEDENKPWPLNYRYVGPINVTKSGTSCLFWYDLDMHFYYPLGDLTENYCRNPVGLLLTNEDGELNTKPMCFTEADLSEDYHTWAWEECDIPICDEDCARDESLATDEMPYCDELIEPNPDRMAAVSVLTTAGVGIGDDVENIDLDVIGRMCGEDGRIMAPDVPARASPAQILEMAFGGQHAVTDPTSAVGEIWYTWVTLGGEYFGVLFHSANSITAEMSPRDFGLSLVDGIDYVTSTYKSGLAGAALVNSSTAFSLPEEGDLDFDIVHFSPLWETTSETSERLAFVGDASKYVPFSRGRFTDLSFDGEMLTVTSRGDVPALTFAVVTGSDAVEELTFECPTEEIGGSAADVQLKDVTYQLDFAARSVTFARSGDGGDGECSATITDPGDGNNGAKSTTPAKFALMASVLLLVSLY